MTYDVTSADDGCRTSESTTVVLVSIVALVSDSHCESFPIGCIDRLGSSPTRCWLCEITYSMRCELHELGLRQMYAAIDPFTQGSPGSDLNPMIRIILHVLCKVSLSRVELQVRRYSALQITCIYFIHYYIF